MSATQQTFNEMLESLTGYEEIAIREAFGASISDLLEAAYTTAGRAMVLVDAQRKGQSAKDAKKTALSMTIKQVNDFFAADEEEVFEHEPVTEQGKDDSLD